MGFDERFKRKWEYYCRIARRGSAPARWMSGCTGCIGRPTGRDIGRRQFLTGGSVLAAAAPIGGMGAAPPSDLHFEVFRNDSRIGHHAINFHTEGDTMVRTSRWKSSCGWGRFRCFRYTHSVREGWRGDRFLSLESETTDDGTPYHVEGQQRRRPRHRIYPNRAARGAGGKRRFR